MSAGVFKPEDMITRVAQALGSNDLDSLMQLYEPSAVLVRPDGTEAQGVDQIRAEYAGYIDKVVSMEAKVLWVHIAGEIATVRGKFSITFARKDGTTITRGGEPIEVLRRQEDDSWLYLIDHGSGANAAE